jgi:thiamine biosynthesis lipoprotein
MQLDFGGFVKEYAADRVAQQLRDAGFTNGLVDLGGDLAVVGPHPDGSPWRVGIRDPHAPGRALGAIALARGGIATSGDYERGMLVDGRRYGHILDPRSGWPVEGLVSVSVVADQCLVAGTAATVAMLRGHGGKRWLRELGLPFAAVDGDAACTGPLLGDPQRAAASTTRSPARARRSAARESARRNATSSTFSPSAKRYGA